MTRTIIALYNDLTSARSVVEAFVAEGIDRNSISLIASDSSGKYALSLKTDTKTEKSDDVHGGEGASFGAVVGALVGLGAMLIPGVGPVIAAGPLVAGLVGAGVGAATGAVTGGITASLVKTGIDEETAGYYGEGVRRGGALVVAHVEDNWNDKVLEIMNDHDAVDINTQAEEWRSSGWKGFDESNSDYTSTYPTVSRQTTGNGNDEARLEVVEEVVVKKDVQERIETIQDTVRRKDVNVEQTGSTTNGVHRFEEYDPTFRSHYQSTYANSGNAYDYYSPAYQYGYSLANDDRYRDYDWQRVEADARSSWESNNKGTWDKIKDAVRNAWDNVREAVN